MTPTRVSHRWSVLVLLVVLYACGPIQDVRLLPDVDLAPPTLTGLRAIGRQQVELSFDEPAFLVQDSVQIEPSLEIEELSSLDSQVVVTVAEQSPGRQYALEAVAKDARGNSMSFKATFCGYNPDVPAVLINEFTTRGSARHPDIVELAVLSDGNMGGVVLYEGTAANWTERLLFPPFWVQEGEFIVVHFKPQVIPEEHDETEFQDASGGLDAVDSAYDFWVPDGQGISANNGALSLYDLPNGRLLDGVLYSNRTSASDSRYRGFGRRGVLECAEDLVQEQGWAIAGELVRPEDGVNPDGSTATRSVCRDSASTDTDSRDDWHIVPTRQATFGQVNSDEVHIP